MEAQAATGCEVGAQGAGDDCNLSLLFQHRAAGERRYWGLFSLYSPVQAPLSITQELLQFTVLCTKDMN